MIQNKVFLVAIILLLSFSDPAFADQLGDAHAALDRKDYVTALRLLEPLANQGNPSAQTFLGDMYYNGQGVPIDYGKALLWRQKAASQGDPEGQRLLARMYHLGQGVGQDDVEALKWLHMSIDQGDEIAMSTLSAMYALGKGVPKDIVEEVKWLRKAADYGDTIAPPELAHIYFYGDVGVPRDYAEVDGKNWTDLSLELRCGIAPIMVKNQGDRDGEHTKET